MSKFPRKQIGQTVQYKGHPIRVLFCGPDLICEVDGEDLPNFYLTASAAVAAGERHVDEVERAKK